MGKINYRAIYDTNKEDWKALTENPQRYEALLAGHYSDSNHFVYELLQNAEDERASKVVIELFKDKLVFYHNGTPFNEADVRGVSSMLMGTKDREDAQTIGRFGMGFKSVFKYTYQPEIYSDEETFKITRYLLPEEIETPWDYKAEKELISYDLGEAGVVYPFRNEEHLTKIVIPFLKYGKDGSVEAVSGEDVLYKLQGLDGQILLFLNSIKSLYWINKEDNRFALITLEEDQEKKGIITCKIESSSKEDAVSSKYLKFKKVFNHPEMRNAEVSVAYKLNSRGDNINAVEDSPIWVYFPTRDETDLPFLIHGSFETAVSREKLMFPSKFNDALFDQLGDLIAESMIKLAERKLITHAFFRKILLKAFEDEEFNDTIPGLKEKVTDVIRENGLLPDRDGNYRKPSDLLLAVPFRISDFVDNIVVGKALMNARPFVVFNSEASEPNFIEYFSWLRDSFEIKVYTLSDLASDLSLLSGTVLQGEEEIDALKEFYTFLSDNRDIYYLSTKSIPRKRVYEKTIIDDIEKAWRVLQEAPVILNLDNGLVPAKVFNKNNIYLAASSDYKKVSRSSLVNPCISDDFRNLLVEGFKIPEFDNFQYVKESIVAKYITTADVVSTIHVDDDEYTDDLNQIISLMNQTNDIEPITNMVKDAAIIRISEDDDKYAFAKPKVCFSPTSEEGIDLEVYFWPVEIPVGLFGSAQTYRKDPPCHRIDRAFYEQKGISVIQLSKLGMVLSPVHDGERSEERQSRKHWYALGEFCPNLSIDYLYENMCFIEGNPDSDLAKEKSVEIYKLIIKIWKKLQGTRRVGTKNSYETDIEEAEPLRYSLKGRKWIFGKDVKNYKPSEISKYDLNQGLYGDLIPDKRMYSVLGFAEKEIDETIETFEQVSGLNQANKLILLKQLAKELGKEIGDSRDDDFWDEGFDSEEADVFNPNAWVDDDFPTNRIRNIDYLIRHVQEQFYLADPVVYKKVLRQIRVSKDSAADKAYVISMYTNLSNVTICQICRKPVAFLEVNQIANFGIEMPQLNLCLCRGCAAHYKALRDHDKEIFKEEIARKLSVVDTTNLEDDYAVELPEEVTIHFTQTHIAEIQEIIRLLEKYGPPEENHEEDEIWGDIELEGSVDSEIESMEPEVDFSNEVSSDEYDHEEVEERIEGKPETYELDMWDKPENEDTNGYSLDDGSDEPELLDDVAKEGSVISFRRGKASIVSDVVLTPKTHAIHRVFLGHRAGETVKFMGKDYEILEVKQHL